MVIIPHGWGACAEQTQPGPRQARHHGVQGLAIKTTGFILTYIYRLSGCYQYPDEAGFDCANLVVSVIESGLLKPLLRPPPPDLDCGAELFEDPKGFNGAHRVCACIVIFSMRICG